MFGLDPEKIMRGLMGATGVSPDDFVGFINTVMTEIREIRADRLAFRPASIKAYQDVTARLDRIENKLDRVVTLLHHDFLSETSGDKYERVNGT